MVHLENPWFLLLMVFLPVFAFLKWSGNRKSEGSIKISSEQFISPEMRSRGLLRYRIIDRSIRNEYNPYPTKEQLRQACEEEIYGTSEGLHICHSTIEKDIFAMRMEHDAPIAYSKREKGLAPALSLGLLSAFGVGTLVQDMRASGCIQTRTSSYQDCEAVHTQSRKHILQPGSGWLPEP